ncbi:MAG: DUF4836 family protein [Mediterranea massiliensis]|nr:DUF4836 family protein [Mediterranea massiliensis]
MKTIISILTVLILFTSCQKEVAKSIYTDVIPANAQEVMIFDIQTLTQKAGLGNPSGLINLFMEQSQLNISEQIGSIVSNWVESGIDLNLPVYLFKAPSLHTSAITLKVSNFTKLDLLLNLAAKAGLCSTPTQNGNHFRSTLKEFPLQLAYNDGTLLLIYHEKITELQKLSPAIDELMQQTTAQSLSNSDVFKQISNLKGDIRLITIPDNLPIEIRGTFSLQQNTQLVGAAFFDRGQLKALLKRSDFNGEVYISSTPTRPQSSNQLQSALYGIMRGRPFHLELYQNELMTVSNLHIRKEFSPNDPEVLQQLQLISKIDKLTLQGDNNLLVLTVDLANKHRNALQDIVEWMINK